MGVKHQLRPRERSEVGATAAEYALMVAVIAAVIVAAVAALGGATDGLFQSICAGSNPLNC